MAMKIFTKMKQRDMLMNAFTTGEIYHKTVRNGVTLKNFPSILDMKTNENRTQYVFKLPFGFDPKEIRKKEFLFQQLLGENIEIKEENSVVSISVYHKVENEFYEYDFEELLPYLKKHNLPIVAGKDKLGKVYVFDLTKCPGLLIGGETGGGKSTMLRAIIATLILFMPKMKHGLQLYLVDFKRSEFHMFRHIENVVVLNTVNNLMKILNGIDKEIDKRGEILDDNELTHIDDYNNTKGSLPKPYIVLCIDEIHELKGDDKVFEKLHRISAMGRALGIFLIVATQRPDRDVVESKTKAELTVRYGFATSSKINSDIILDRVKEDSSKIQNDGEFYYRNLKASKKIELLKGPFLTPEKAKELLEPLKVRLEEREPNENENIIDMEGEERENVEPIETVQIGLLEGGGDE